MLAALTSNWGSADTQHRRGQSRARRIQTNTSMMLPSRPTTGTTLAAAEDTSLARRATD